MNKKKMGILRVIRGDIEILNLNFSLDDNSYYWDLIKGNIEDIICGRYAKKEVVLKMK